jgi:hypothetical protein
MALHECANLCSCEEAVTGEHSLSCSRNTSREREVMLPDLPGNVRRHRSASPAPVQQMVEHYRALLRMALMNGDALVWKLRVLRQSKTRNRKVCGLFPFFTSTNGRFLAIVNTIAFSTAPDCRQSL